MQEFELGTYLSSGVERIVKEMLGLSLSNPKQSIFMAQYTMAARKARKLREKAELKGDHIPPFLIASITDQCNLRCLGCYASENKSCRAACGSKELASDQWGEIFHQAEELGISFILLAGGEPLIRKDVLREAGKYQRILFPVFTNGTLLEEAEIQMFQSFRNLIPVLSLEGGEEATDLRRGDGVYASLNSGMERLAGEGIMFGASVTVTKKNLEEVTSDQFLGDLKDKGCKAVVYVEYVPADRRTEALAPGEPEREYLKKRLLELRSVPESMLLVSFPGDEKESGGCLAAGRGFFHINSGGGAEPCPFSPFSDTSLLHTSLRGALASPLFRKLHKEGILEQEHIGGCVLFEQERIIREYMGAE